jgi:thiamine-phosphate pyrophosphorylase
LQQVLSTWDQSALLAARDAQHDVGRTEKQAAELSREDGLLDIAASAAGRCEQGLRVLEESAKFLFPATATAIESIRYRVYDLDAELQLALQRDLAFLDRSQLYVLVDCQLPLARFVERIEAISNAGVDLIQIRDKAAQAVTQIQYANAAADTVDPSITRIIMNDRIDIASCCKAWGCHIGQEDLPPVTARGLLRGQQILGVSTHHLGQIQKAVDDLVDYIGCGPTFPSQTKSFDQFAGLSFLEQAVQYLIRVELKLPAFAIGGIHPGNLHQVLDAGFDRIAVSSCVWNSNDPAGVSEQLKKRLLAKRGGRTA